MKDFEWDENKREINLEKHGIDFIDIIEIFDDFYRIESEILRKDELRYQTIGMVNEVIVFVVYVIRRKKRRIISARKASKNERRIYEESKG